MEPDSLRFITAGSVDDGKSTLIGRLLHDTGGVYDDQVESVRKASPGGLELAFLTDGLRAEREQGITIDVAYRYFATPRRRFIIADTPGHEQYTRNMATGASTAQVALVLLDARKGVLPQTRRHASIAWLLGIRRIALVINKMDLVDWSRDRFEAIQREFENVAQSLPGCSVDYIPLSALSGENVVRRGEHMPWYDGGALLEFLETVPVDDVEPAPFRLPVQYVIRSGDFRGYAGKIAAGQVRAGDRITVLPSGRAAQVSSVCSYDGDLEVGSSRVDLQACKLEYSIVSPK